MKKRSNPYIYIFGSLLLIIVAIATTSIYSRANENTPEDIRTKAGTTATIKVAGIVSSISETQGFFVVDNLRFSGTASGNKNLGSWTVTPPIDFSVSSLTIGDEVTLTVDPLSLVAQKRTVTATEINIQ